MPPEKTCEFHEKRSEEMAQTRSKVDSIGGKLNVLIALILLMLAGHGFLYLQFADMKEVTGQRQS
jgi:hypothetical protein